MGLSVDKVYRFCQFVANKESKGWVSPLEFNISAELAEITVYSRLEAGFLSNKKIHSDMRPFLKKDVSLYSVTNHAFPTGFRQLLGARISSNNKVVVELTQAELNDAMDSVIVAPSTAYPNCVVRDDGIYVYPATITDELTIEYISKIVTPPLWAYTSPQGRPIYYAVGSDDFTLEDNLFIEISMLILANMGMNIGKESVTQYGMAFTKAG